MLQSPVVLQLGAGIRQTFINYVVRVRSHMIRNLMPVRQIYKYRSTRLRSIVYTNGIFSSQMSSLLDRFMLCDLKDLDISYILYVQVSAKKYLLLSVICVCSVLS
ncbi:hypothetical protein D3C80_1579730 [compost metagenome]